MIKAIRLALFAAVVALFVAVPIAQQSAEASTPARYTAMRFAVAQKGKPYRYGGTGPSSYDCSGLAYVAYRKAGFRSIPRTADAIYHWSRSHHISISSAKWGDLVFWVYNGHASHVEFVTTKRHLTFGAHHSGTVISYRWDYDRSHMHYVHIS